MNKKGQIYLLAALILGFIIFLLAAETNVVKKTVIDDDFESLARNYEVESAKFMNQILEQGVTDIPQEFLKFTIVFSAYAKTKNPEFGVIYAFIFNNRVYMGNYLDTEIQIPRQIPLSGCYQRLNTNIVVAGFPVQSSVTTGAFSSCMLDIPIPPANKLRFFIEGIEYEVELEPTRPEIIIVSRENINNERKVFVKGNFNKGRNI
ncbi:MAG TPA: hypothetical protein VJH37_01435 [Candidatus Nanoarchaeia archaeon]|nr:hypothetical protein [Candidatus Nanoarchaeia archaeon]